MLAVRVRVVPIAFGLHESHGTRRLYASCKPQSNCLCVNLYIGSTFHVCILQYITPFWGGQSVKPYDDMINALTHTTIVTTPSYDQIRFLPHGKQHHVITSVICKTQHRPHITKTTTFILETCTQTPDTLKSCNDQTTQEGYYGNHEAMTIQTDNRKPDKVDRP